MASIQKIEGKTGASYKITVTLGEDYQGKKIRHYKTWKPDRPMTAKQAEKEAKRVAYEFERSIEQGFQADNRQTFAEYARYVIQLQEQKGVALSTLDNYEFAMERIVPAFGHMKLRDIKPQTLNNFYRSLMQPGVLKYQGTAIAKVDLKKLLADRGMYQRGENGLDRASGVCHTTVEKACNGRPIRADKAECIANALGEKVDTLFTIKDREGRLSASAIRIHHGLISVVFAQAEREMLISFNPAERATPPPTENHDPVYLQPDELGKLLDAVEAAPIKWRTITYFLAVTGCRIGEALGVKWEKVDLEDGTVKIDTSMNYLPKVGTYEGPTKTRKSRYVTLPAEMITRLKQYRAWQSERRLLLGGQWVDTGLVFTRDDGGPLIKETYRTWLAGLCRRNGLRPVHPHSLRHTFASVLISEGVDIVTVSKMLGHANTSMTTDVYSHIIEESKRKATECIADVMLRKKKA